MNTKRFFSAMSTSAVMLFSAMLMYGFSTVENQPGNTASNGSDTLSADSLDLSKYKGKVVVLNFWASWSKASRTENKNLVRIYQKYKSNAKVVFVSVSLDTDQASWKSAIEEDELAWKDHQCDFKKYESPIAVKYNVNTLPKILLIDANGAVSASSAKMIDLENSIDKLLK